MKTVVTVLISVITFSSQLLGQNIPYNQEFQVNTYTDGEQLWPSLAALSDGGFIVCWTGNSKVFGQRFNSSGEKNGPEFQVNTDYIPYQRPLIAAFPNSGFVVFWTSDGHVSGQRFNSVSEKIGTEFQVNTSDGGDKPALAVLSNGGFVICWRGREQGGSGYGVFCQRFSPNCEKVSSEFRVDSQLAVAPSLTALSDSGFVVCWEGRQDGSGYGVFGQGFNSNGEKTELEFQICPSNDWRYFTPNIAMLSNGEIVVSWETGELIGHAWVYTKIFAQLFDVNGLKRGDKFQVNTFFDKDQDGHDLTALTDGGFVVNWISGVDGRSRLDVLGQRFNSNGEKYGDEFQMSTNTEDFQRYPVLTALPDGGFLVAWSSDHNAIINNNYDIYAKYFLEEPIQHNLTSFSLEEPLDDASLNEYTPLFTWQKPSSIRECYPWELTYDLYIDTNTNFTNPRIITGIQDTTYRIDALIPDRTYFWKVLAHNLAGDSLWIFCDTRCGAGERFTCCKHPSFIHPPPKLRQSIQCHDHHSLRPAHPIACHPAYLRHAGPVGGGIGEWETGCRIAHHGLGWPRSYGRGCAQRGVSVCVAN